MSRATAAEEFEKYCRAYPKTAEDMGNFLRFAGELGVLSATPTGSDVATLCRAYQEGRRRYLRQLSETNLEKYQCKQELRQGGVTDEALLETTCAPIQEPKLTFPRIATAPTIPSREQISTLGGTRRTATATERVRPAPTRSTIFDRARTSLERTRQRAAERRRRQEEEDSCIRRVMVTGKNRRDAERFCRK